MKDNLELIRSIFSEPLQENVSDVPENVPLEHGTYVGGVYNGRKYMYSKKMIESLPKDKLETFIRNQIGA